MTSTLTRTENPGRSILSADYWDGQDACTWDAPGEVTGYAVTLVGNGTVVRVTYDLADGRKGEWLCAADSFNTLDVEPEGDDEPIRAEAEVSRALERASDPSIVVRRFGNRQVEVLVDGTAVAETDYDAVGWSGMEALITAVTKVAEALGVRAEVTHE